MNRRGMMAVQESACPSRVLLSNYTTTGSSWECAETFDGGVLADGGYIDIQMSNVNTDNPARNSLVLSIGQYIDSWRAGTKQIYFYKMAGKQLRVQSTSNGSPWQNMFVTPSTLSIQIYYDRIVINGQESTLSSTAVNNTFTAGSTIKLGQKFDTPVVETIDSITLYY